MERVRSKPVAGQFIAAVSDYVDDKRKLPKDATDLAGARVPDAYIEWFAKHVGKTGVEKDCRTTDDPLICDVAGTVFQEGAEFGNGKDLETWLEDNFAWLCTKSLVNQRQDLFLKGYWIPLIRAVATFDSLRNIFWPLLSFILMEFGCPHVPLLGRL